MLITADTVPCKQQSLARCCWAAGSFQPGCTAHWWLCCSQHHGNPAVSDNPAVSMGERKQSRHPDGGQAVLFSSQHSLSELQEFIFPFGAPGLDFQNENHILSFLFRQKISSLFPAEALLVLQRCKRKSGSGSCLKFNFLRLPDQLFWSALCSPYRL